MDVQQTARRTVASRYLTTERIPTLGAGDLYRATHAETRQAVVLREFAPADRSPADALATLSKVAAVFSRFLNSVSDASQVDDQRIYVAHPLLSGESLAERLARKTKLAIPEAVALWVRIGKGLDALHTRGLVHGGLRPSRVFHERAEHGWHLKLLSAGVSNVSPDAARADAKLVRYAPPEWLANGEWTAQSDIWCAAVIVYEALAGVGPYDASSASEIGGRIAAGQHTPLATLAPDVPSELAQLIADSLSLDPQQRPDRGGALVQKLLEAFPESRGTSRSKDERWTKGHMVNRPGHGGGVTAAQSPTEIRRRQRRALNRAQLSGAIAVAIVAAALLVLVYVRHRDAERDLLARLDHQRAEQQHALDVIRAREAALAAQAAAADSGSTAPVQPPTTNTAAAADAGVTVAVANVPHRTPRAPDSRPITAPDATTDTGALEFRSATPCALMLDGSNRGDVSYLQTTLRAGSHQITCRGGSATQRLLVRIEPGRVTRVHVTSTGESAISTEGGQTP